MQDAIEPEFMAQNTPAPLPATTGEAKGATVPGKEERDADLRWLKMSSGEDADEFATDFLANACRIGEKYIAALAFVESQLEQVENRSDEWKRQYIDAVHERDATVESITAQRDSAIKSLGERDRALELACETITRIRPSGGHPDTWREAFRHQAALEVKSPEQAAEEFRQRNIEG